MLKMRLKRCGKKRQTTYKIVIMNSISKRDGKEIKYLGYYNPKTKELKINLEDIIFNLSVGVQPTKTLENLLLKTKIISKK
jgi:small subunit ribosomal protein S16